MSAPVLKEVSLSETEASRPSLGKRLRAKFAAGWAVKKTRRKMIIAMGIPLAAVAAFEGYRMWSTEETDDAFVTTRVHAVGARVAGNVIEVLVQENQHVKKGDLLARLDPRDYEAQVKAAEAGYSRAHRDLSRWAGAGSLQMSDRLVKNSEDANALTSEATLEQAKLRLEYTSIIAPEDGTIGARSVETGEGVQPGQALFSLVENTPWIVANFKEGQTAHIKPGQEVEIEIDAVAGYSFKGKVDSLAPGSGATFALLPPDNATGNFTKVVQRIPVKIVFEPESLKRYGRPLAAGMSSNVTVRVR
ncbi:MAG: HlyD family secretion protein [Proteobacteria bacterium]|nr:MAG: HlyD family secretion protein [Pseudomonadota bacterium]